ncbi:MAG: hypothetical protein J0L75_04160 [Spirochaetes bacterium]|nr:hypothetical protein [Spirochaetota bacterium]
MSGVPGNAAHGEPASKPIAFWVLGAGIFVAVIVVVTVLIYRHLLERSQDAAEAALPAREWTVLRENERKDLEKAYWLDRSAGKVHLPIGAAMEKVVKEYSR